MNITRNIYWMALLTFSLFSCRPEPAVETEKITGSEDLVMATLWYQASDEMKAQYEQAYARALELLEKNRGLVDTSKAMAVILDIDETVLDNSPYEARLVEDGEIYNSYSWAKWVKEAKAKALPGALAFTNKAKDMGVEVFYISNRKDELKEPTLQNLQNENFPFATKDHLLLKTDKSDKTARRKKVTEKYKVLLMVGDQLSDFSENYELSSDTLKNYFVILPNPMYGRFEEKAYSGDFSLSVEERANKRREALNTER